MTVDDLLARVAGQPVVLLAATLLSVLGCSSRLRTDQEKHPECYRPARYGVSDLPQLVEHLGDPTLTVTPVDYVGGLHAVGDEALEAIFEVIPDLLIDSFTPPSCAPRWTEIGVGAYYEYVRADPANRIRFREAVRKWIADALPSQRDSWGRQKWIPIPGY